MCVHSCIWLFITPWTVARKIPLSVDLSRKKILEWVVISFSTESSPPRDQTHVSCVSFAGGFFTANATWEAQIVLHISRQLLHPWINTGRNSHCKLTQVSDQPSRLKANSLKTIKKWAAALTWQNYLLKYWFRRFFSNATLSCISHLRTLILCFRNELSLGHPWLVPVVWYNY